MSDGIGRRDALFIAGGLLLGLLALGAGLVWLLEGDAAVDPGSITPEQARALAEQPAETIDTDAEPRAIFERHHALDDGAGGLLVTGLVRNTSATFLDRPEVVAVCRGAAGADEVLATGKAEREVLVPGATSPIEIAVPRGRACETLDYELTPRKPEVVAVYAPGLRVEASPSRLDGEAWEFTGTVLNEGDRRARYVQVQVLALDVVGRIVGVDSVYAHGDLLAPSGRTRFRLGPVRYLKAPERFEFTAYGRSSD